MNFPYKSKGTADDWSMETIEAEDKKDARQSLDEIYGIKRDNSGKQTNEDVVQVVLLDARND